MDNRNINSQPGLQRTGMPLEKQARMRDAEKLSAAGVDPEPLNVYRLEPIAGLDDPRWQNSPYQGTVTVAARTSGDARIVACGRELDYMEVDAKPAEDVTTSNASAFRSEKLYTVIQIEHGRTDLRRGVLEGDISVATIKPVQL